MLYTNTVATISMAAVAELRNEILDNSRRVWPVEEVQVVRISDPNAEIICVEFKRAAERVSGVRTSLVRTGIRICVHVGMCAS